MKWLRRRRRRLKSEAFELSGTRFRLTRQRGKIVGLELWIGPNADGDYGYRVWKTEVDR